MCVCVCGCTFMASKGRFGNRSTTHTVASCSTSGWEVPAELPVFLATGTCLANAASTLASLEHATNPGFMVPGEPTSPNKGCNWCGL